MKEWQLMGIDWPCQSAHLSASTPTNIISRIRRIYVILDACFHERDLCPCPLNDVY